MRLWMTWIYHLLLDLIRILGYMLSTEVSRLRPVLVISGCKEARSVAANPASTKFKIIHNKGSPYPT
jgi:hypothetical protein